MTNSTTNFMVKSIQKLVLASIFMFFVGSSYATNSFHEYYNTIFANLNATSELNKVKDNPRGYLVRKGVKYKWELEQSGRAGQYTYFVHREKGGQSNLVYNTTRDRPSWRNIQGNPRQSDEL